MYHCHIEWQPMTDRRRIWIFAPRLNGGTSYLNPDLVTWTEADTADLAPEEPTLTLERVVFDSLAHGLANHGQPSDAQAIHLRDAIAVRDRLLALVEKAP
jgi:hypothetical protein